jgi:arginine/lysine/ornithine decarboxylase
LTKIATADELSGTNRRSQDGTVTKPTPLSDAIEQHLGFEVASFHTPGHKGRLAVNQGGASTGWALDVTELAGLDELSAPTGVLADLEARAARLWKAKNSIISVNGASACLAAALIAVAKQVSTAGATAGSAKQRNKVLVPRNAHRSVIHGLILSGLFPLWYEPKWDAHWQIYSSVESFGDIFEQAAAEIAGVVVVSPTYAGSISKVTPLAEICHAYNIPLIVDEAHGAHFLPETSMPRSAIAQGADVVVHSLHKTASALTQCAVVHINHGSLVHTSDVRAALNLLTTSSPSYVLMASIEQAIAQLEGDDGRTRVELLRQFNQRVREGLADLPDLTLYQAGDELDPAHILVGTRRSSPEKLAGYLQHWGIFPEAVLGEGVLLLLGLGTTSGDIEHLLSALADFQTELSTSKSSLLVKSAETSGTFASLPPPLGEQKISPRQAVFMPSKVVPIAQAIGQIAAETIAPCPPGVPVIVAGQVVPEQILEMESAKSKPVKFVKVVVE